VFVLIVNATRNVTFPRGWNIFGHLAVISGTKNGDVRMGWFSRLFGTKDDARVDNPATAFEKPSDVLKDSKLSKSAKVAALDTWEQDARQLMTASNEGMPGSDEGLGSDDHHQMGQVIRAKEKIGEKPNHKPAH
jgi:hypothetical protein